MSLEQPPGGTAVVDEDEILLGRKIPLSNSTRDASPQDAAREAARFLLRQDVYTAAEQASIYLDCLRSVVAADDAPGIRYAYAKFAAFGRAVALGCKELTASGEGQP